MRQGGSTCESKQQETRFLPEERGHGRANWGAMDGCGVIVRQQGEPMGCHEIGREARAVCRRLVYRAARAEPWRNIYTLASVNALAFACRASLGWTLA